MWSLDVVVISEQGRDVSDSGLDNSISAICLRRYKNATIIIE